MISLSSVGLGLTLVFGCLLLALVAELYYLLWWKKRFTNTNTNREIEDVYIFCWKNPSSSSPSLSSTTGLNPQLCSSIQNRDIRFENHETEEDTSSSTQIHGHGNKDMLLKPFGEDGVESEFMRLYDLSSGPPRFLFTIKEETREDLDESLSDRHLVVNVETTETPFLTPFSSPQFFTPPLSPITNSTLYNYNGFSFNPLYDSPSDAMFNKIRSSPPPKFKFLQDAEEKHYRRKLVEQDEK